MGTDENKPATASEIRGLVGDADDAVVTSILQTRATVADLSLAMQWLRGGGGVEDEAGHEPHGPAKLVYDILQVEEPEEP